jgi:hypothetical protein
MPNATTTTTATRIGRVLAMRLGDVLFLSVAIDKKTLNIYIYKRYFI